MRIEILTFDGCPNAKLTIERVENALRSAGVNAEVSQLEVDTPELARKMRFLGSPTVRINGLDVVDGDELDRSYGLMCRTYRSGENVDGAPSIDVITQAIRRAI